MSENRESTFLTSGTFMEVSIYGCMELYETLRKILNISKS
jgi:hypothetical protein